MIESDAVTRKAGLFGIFGGHVCVTDGRHVYMRACADRSNQPLDELTLMPTRMAWRFDPAELSGAELSPPLPFTKNAPVLKLPGRAIGNPIMFGTLIFDLEADPDQASPIDDPDLELRLAQMLVDAMRANDAPESQFDRLGLPPVGAVTREHLQVERQWRYVTASESYARRNDRLEDYGAVVRRPIRELMTDPDAADLLATHFGVRPSGPMLGFLGHLNPWQISVMMPGLSGATVRDFEQALEQRSRAAPPDSTS